MPKAQEICESMKRRICSSIQDEHPDIDQSVLDTINDFKCSTKGRRQPSEWNTFVSEQRKAGLSMREVADKWKDMKGKKE